MTYTAFKAAIRSKLQREPEGLPWTELRDSLNLPYDRPCPEWVKRLEQDIGLTRSKGSGRAYFWHLS
jgi:hypothetical protein